MDRALDYQVEVTADLARASAAALERSLWTQHERIYGGTIRYSLDAAALAVPLAIAAGGIVCAFAKPYARNPIQVLYLPGSAERAALLAALRERGATVVEAAP